MLFYNKLPVLLAVKLFPVKLGIKLTPVFTSLNRHLYIQEK